MEHCQVKSIKIAMKGGIDKYPAKAHCQRVADKLNFENGVIVLCGEQAAVYSDSDQPCPFRQNSYFYYLTGCNEPGCYVTYEIEEDKTTLWIPTVDLTRVYYDGKSSTTEEAMDLYDIDEARYLKGGKRGVKNLRLMLADHAKAEHKFAFLKGTMKCVGGQLFRTSLKGKKIRGMRLKRAMDACRAVKDEHEVSLVRSANLISSDAHTNILKKLHGLKNEPEVEAAFMERSIALGAREQAYTPICGAGLNAGQLHYVDNNQSFGSAKVLLVDAGAEWRRYASDVTRTMPINPSNPGHWPSTETETIYRAVERIQHSCFHLIGPGRRFIDVNWHAQFSAISILVELGILVGDRQEIFHAGTALAFFPHGLGHHLGLDVHDVAPPQPKELKGSKKEVDPRFRNVRRAFRTFAKANPEFAAPSTFAFKKATPENFSLLPSQCLSPNTPTDPPLETGNIITVEPGLYFNRFVLEKFFLHNEKHKKFINPVELERYMHVGGVRIEDDVLITKDWHEILTTAPKGDAMLQVIREGAKGKCG